MGPPFATSLSAHVARLAPCSGTDNPHTPFALLHVPHKQIAFHLVDLATYRQLSAEQDCEYFFKNLTEKYEQQGMQLVHVWEDVWLRQPAQVEARIAALLGHFTRYHARLTTVQKITNPVLLDFLRHHHLQTPIGGRYKYGLFHKGEMVAVASFSAARPIVRGGMAYRSYELLRFANKAGCVVAGGLSKLLAHFIGEHHPDDIMTYADRDWGSGRGYKMLGFEQVGELPPQAFLLDTATHLRHYPHQRSKAEGDVKIFNAGSWKFVRDVRKEGN